ncbi:hypothetical protein, partial [Stenotrophomonas maltophilia]|uniref:hypothetical protein n=1 Tax=Stenotrophomonas maltophilia TaxID=40324 RepID=UPI001A7E09EA
MPPFVVTAALMLMAQVISYHCLPQATLKVKGYRRLSDTEFRFMRKEVEEFAEADGGRGLVVSSRDEGEGYFELWADREPVIVDNSPIQLVVVIAEHSAERVPHTPLTA